MAYVLVPGYCHYCCRRLMDFALKSIEKKKKRWSEFMEVSYQNLVSFRCKQFVEQKELGREKNKIILGHFKILAKQIDWDFAQSYIMLLESLLAKINWKVDFSDHNHMKKLFWVIVFVVWATCWFICHSWGQPALSCSSALTVKCPSHQ